MTRRKPFFNIVKSPWISGLRDAPRDFEPESTIIFEFSISVYSCLVHVYGTYIDSDGMKRAEGKGLDFSDLIPEEQVIYF